MHRARRFAALLLVAAAPSCGAPPAAETPHAPEPVAAEVPPAPNADAPSDTPGDGPEAAAAAPEETPRAEHHAAAAEILGTLVSRSGDEIIVEAGEALPAAGAKGSLLKRFEQEIGPIKATGWLGIADVTVRKVSGRRVVLAIVAEKSIVLVNGKKVDHFTAGSQVKIEMTR